LVVIWNRRPGVLLRKWGMLVLDAFMGHLTPEMKATITGSYLNTDVAIPGRMSSQLQVLEVVMNKLFKDCLKQLCREWLLTGGHALNPAGRIKKSSVILYQGIITAWPCISPEVTLKGFK
jgi:hypothetical protein